MLRFSEVKKLFILEFMRIPMSIYERHNTWITFCEDLYTSGSINYRVYTKCMSIA